MKRRRFLVSAAAGISGFAGCGSTPETTPTVGSAARSNAEKLERLIEDDFLDAEENSLFVGNPDFYEYGLSELTASDNPGTSFIEDRVRGGENAEDIWRQIAAQMDGEQGEILDNSFTDPLDYDLLEKNQLDILVLNSSSSDFIRDSADRAMQNIDETLGINTALEIRNSDTYSQQELINVVEDYPDTLVFHTFAGDGRAGSGAPNLNAALVNTAPAESSNRPVETLAKIFEHEAHHTTVNMPHLPYDGENLMSVRSNSAAEAVLTEQARQMAEKYMSSELEHDAFIEDGVGKVKVSFSPTYSIEDGEKYLEQNTQNALLSLEFPVEKWDLQAYENTVEMENNGVRVILEPDKEHGYASVETVY